MRYSFFQIVASSLLFFLSCSQVVVNAENCEIYSREPYIDARCAIAIDSKTKVVLYESNSQLLVPMASTTKIITALVALKYDNLDKKIKISKRAASIRGSTVGYKIDEEITLRELVYGLMLRSGNDAAIAIAEGIGGSVEEFLNVMNEYACEIGLTDTHFESPHGLDRENHYTTAYDLAIVTAKAKEIKEFNEIVSAKNVDGATLNFTRSYNNINKILWQIPSANGVKTGYTGKAGKCLVSSIDYEGNDIIIVVLNSRKRWKETERIYDYIVKEYEYKKMATKGQVIANINVKHGVSKINLISNTDIVVPVRKNAEVTYKVVIPANIKAPLLQGDKLGNFIVFENDKLIFTSALVIDNTVRKKGMFRR